MLVAHASQTGTAQDLARRSAECLRAAGDADVQVLPLAALEDAQLQHCQRLYVVASTTGEGDPPDAALAFAARMDRPASLPRLRHAVLALGDRRYAAFCGFGVRVDAWLRAAGAAPLHPMRTVDNADPVALQAWFDALARDAADAVDGAVCAVGADAADAADAGAGASTCSGVSLPAAAREVSGIDLTVATDPARPPATPLTPLAWPSLSLSRSPTPSLSSSPSPAPWPSTPSPSMATQWILASRRLANPGSLGAGAYAVALRTTAGAPVDWQAGDLVEITPRNPPDAVDEMLAALRAPANLPVVDVLRRPTRLDALLATAELPDPSDLPAAGDIDAVDFAHTLPPLRSRSYSIASLPADGVVELLVRRHRRPDGREGVGSGWLCRHLAEGQPVDARLRPNPSFHAPDPSRPLILVGNGTGVAGLRAHLRARIAAGARRQWLLLGERQAACDALYGDEFDALLASDRLDALDHAWSRDGRGPRYVQDALAAQAPRLRAWVDDGACIYVCGSAAGMAPGVDAVLREALGGTVVDALRRDGRYRRDVY